MTEYTDTLDHCTAQCKCPPINPAGNNLGYNPSLRSGRPTTSRLSHGTGKALLFLTVRIWAGDGQCHNASASTSTLLTSNEMHQTQVLLGTVHCNASLSVYEVVLLSSPFFRVMCGVAGWLVPGVRSPSDAAQHSRITLCSSDRASWQSSYKANS
jgi:hypothetical protein